LLWVLLTSFLGLIGFDLITAVRILSFLGMSTIIISVSLHSLSLNSWKATTATTLTLTFLAATAPIAVWAIGGLEQPLYGALIALSIFYISKFLTEEISKQHIIIIGITLGLACLTRPDGPLFTIAPVLAFTIISIYKRDLTFFKKALVLIPIPFIFFVGQLIFRWFYYGELVPNTALVKIAPTTHHLMNGWSYLSSGLIMLSPISFIALFSMIYLLFVKKFRESSILLLTSMILWSAYIIFIGGDIFPAYRHFIPLIVIMAFAIFNITLYYSELFSRLTILKWVGAAFFYFTLILVPFVQNQFENDRNKAAVFERWEWDGKDIGELIQNTLGEKQPLVAVTAAGSIPYWSKTPSLDMLGLNDYYLPRNPPSDFGQGHLGHELGNGQYVLDSNPDIIVFHMGSHPLFRAGAELNSIPKFHDDYVSTNVKYGRHNKNAIFFFNKYGKKTGIKFENSNLMIPGYLFKGSNNYAIKQEKNTLSNTILAKSNVQLSIEIPAQTLNRIIQKQLTTINSNETGLDIQMQKQASNQLKIIINNNKDNSIYLDSIHLEY